MADSVPRLWTGPSVYCPRMSLAAISVAALVLAVVLSCITTVNVGVLAVALAWIIGVYVGHMPLATVIAGFPTQLFLTLTGVTLLFTMAQCNGTLDRLAHHAVRGLPRATAARSRSCSSCWRSRLASIGPGNISTAALVAPMAMTTAARANIPPFLMAIMVGNGANAGSLSPFRAHRDHRQRADGRHGMTGYELEPFAFQRCWPTRWSPSAATFFLEDWMLFGRGTTSQSPPRKRRRRRARSSGTTGSRLAQSRR